MYQLKGRAVWLSVSTKASICLGEVGLACEGAAFENAAGEDREEDLDLGEPARVFWREDETPVERAGLQAAILAISLPRGFMCCPLKNRKARLQRAFQGWAVLGSNQ